MARSTLSSWARQARDGAAWRPSHAALLRDQVTGRTRNERNGYSDADHLQAAVAWLDFFSTHYDLFNAQAGFAPAVSSSKGDAFYTEIQKYTSTFQPALAR